jgi:hypothetical protein
LSEWQVEKVARHHNFRSTKSLSCSQRHGRNHKKPYKQNFGRVFDIRCERTSTQNNNCLLTKRSDLKQQILGQNTSSKSPAGLPCSQNERLQLSFCCSRLFTPNRDQHWHPKNCSLANITKPFAKSMRLHHSPDASTFPGFKQTCFLYIIHFSEGIINCTSF